MHLTIESDGTLEGTTVKDAAGEFVGLVESVSAKVSRTGVVERFEVSVNDSATAKKKAAKAEKAAEVEEPAG